MSILSVTNKLLDNLSPSDLKINSNYQKLLCTASFATKAGVYNLFPRGGLGEHIATFSGSGVKPEMIGRHTGVYDGGTRSTNVCRLSSVANRSNSPFELPTNQVTAIAVVYRLGNNANGNAPIFENSSAASTPQAIWGIRDGGGSGTFRSLLNITGTQRQLDHQTAIANNTLSVLALRYDGTKLESFNNGVLSSSNVVVSGNLTTVNDGSRGPTLGNYWNFTGTARSFNGLVIAGFLSPFALADGYIQEITRDYLCVLEPKRRQVYYYSSGAGQDSSGSSGLAQLTLTNITGTGSFTYNAAATANIAGLGLGTITALVNSSALVTANIDSVSLSTLTAEGSAGTGSNSQGSLTQLNLTSVSANIAYGVTRQGSFAGLSLTNVNALTNWTRNASAVADLASVALSTVIGTGSTVSSYSATGSLANLGLNIVSGQASSTISSSTQGLISGLTLTTLTATISSQVSSQVTCIFDGISLSTVLGIGFTEGYPGNIQEFGRLDINFTLEDSRTLVISEDERLLTITEEPGTLTLERL